MFNFTVLVLRNNVLFRNLKEESILRDTQTFANYKDLNINAKFYRLLRAFEKRQRFYILQSFVSSLHSVVSVR